MKTLTTHQLSSGDMIADRRVDYARMLAETGDYAAAADLIRQALHLVPDWPAGWFHFGDYSERAGDREKAIEAYRKVLELSPDDMFGAWLKLSYLGALDGIAQPASLYVEHLFDDYADKFDVSLVEKLDYHVPEQLAALIRAQKPAGHRFRKVVDLGCGTGLFAEAFSGSFEQMEGCDISRKMLLKAKHKGLYSKLFKVDLALPPEKSGLFGADLPDHRADLVTATDVLIYLGDLRSTFQNVVQVIGAKGLFAFSAEGTEEATGVHLGASLRFAHSESYLRGICGDFGFDILATEHTIIRMDAGKPVPGYLVLCEAGNTRP